MHPFSCKRIKIPSRESLTVFLSSVLLSGLLAGLLAAAFYNRPAAVLPLFLLIFPFLRKMQKENALKKRPQLFRHDFRELLAALSFFYRAGREAETAFPETLAAVRETLGPSHPLVGEWETVCRGMRNGSPPDRLLTAFADRTGVEEIENFASVFAAARQTGGDLPALISRASLTLSSRIETEREIEAAIAAKQFEHRIMSAMPCGILFYLRLTDPDFLAPLYNTVPGILVMTASLIIYAAAWFLGKRITDISV